MNKASSIAKAASSEVSAKCGNLMSWLKRKEVPLEKETAAKISLVEEKDASESGKEDVISVRQGSVEYLKNLVEDIGWRRVLLVEFRKEYMDKIVKFLQMEKEKGVKIFPPQHQIFNAFNLTPLKQIRVVLIGQDPYHGENQAHGLCFSVCKGVRLPPSLINIYKELKMDIPNFKVPDHGCLESWAHQGVFMLNATLTVEAHRPNSHNHIGWQKFTDEKKHIVIKTAHPSPLSARMFFGCKCFSRTNEALVKLGQPAIDWSTF
uniref:Uracil-DNA glycosylase n=1 Tax=Loa loa TaxID=7209 RepID=A0A1I7VSV9_LOALO